MWYRPKEPYEPWEIKDSDFPRHSPVEEQAKFLLNYAILAPSTFNTQPWLFLVKKNKITIYPDLSRHLKTSDKNNMLLYISLGCALKNLETAASAFGFKTRKNFINNAKSTVIKVSLTKRDKKISKPPLRSIRKRLTNRSPYLSKAIPGSLLKNISSIARKEGLSTFIVTNKTVKEKIMELVKEGDYTLWNNPKFKEEHLKWIRHNLTTKHDGMPAFSAGIPLILSFFAEFAIKNLNYAKIQSSKNKSLLSTTPYFGFILSEKHDQETWVKVGEVLEEIWLNATSLGVSLAPSAQVVVVGNLYKGLMKILKTNLRPQFFFRLGFASKPAYTSPRRKVEETLIPGENY